MATSPFPIAGFSFRIKRMLSEKSFFIIFPIPSSDSRFTNGILIKSSITADKTKHVIQTHNTGSSPYVLYKIPPSTGPNNEEKELIVLMMEFAAIKESCSTRAGTLACTEGWYAPAMPNKSISVTVINKTRFTSPISKENARIITAVKKSSITIIFRLFTRSATIPPTGDNTIAGINAQAVTVPNSAEDPV